MGNSTENANKKKKLRKQARMIKKRGAEISGGGGEGTGNTGKDNSTTWGNKPESTGERRNIKEIKGKNNTDKTGLSKTTKGNFINNWEGVTRKYTNNRM